MCTRRLTAVLALAVGLVLLGAPALAWGYGDHNGDDTINLIDYAEFPACLAGPGGGLGTGCGVFDFDTDADVDLFDFAGFQRVFGVQAGVVIDTVPVGNPGNANDATGYGAVDYAYNIGKYEVTAGQYTEFLNAVAATDAYGLYNPSMDSGHYGCQITQNGTSGTFTYDFSGGTVEAPGSTAADWADRPVNYVSWGDAARFANWLHNGQPTGAQDLSTTEDGSYFLDGATTDAELLAITRAPDATWVIPSEDEWYKAAYHCNDGVTGNYFDYPMGSDSLPSNYLIDPDPGDSATFYGYPALGYTIGLPYYRTEVGAHENSASPYGAFDQGGNVYEWNETMIDGVVRGLRGGSFSGDRSYMRETWRSYSYPSYENGNDIGFRVAEVP